VQTDSFLTLSLQDFQVFFFWPLGATSVIVIIFWFIGHLSPGLVKVSFVSIPVLCMFLLYCVPPCVSPMSCIAICFFAHCIVYRYFACTAMCDCDCHRWAHDKRQSGFVEVTLAHSFCFMLHIIVDDVAECQYLLLIVTWCLLFALFRVNSSNNILWPFVWDYPGEPVPQETFTHSHLSWSSTILYYDP